LKVEIEIKLRLTGELAQIRTNVRKLGFRISKRRAFESNILFDNVKRTLRKHGKLLRVRRVGQHGLLTFKGPSEQSRYKKRWETETHLHDTRAVEAIFANIGYHPVFRYEKFRTEYTARSGQGKVLLDETPIGNFLELEGTPRWIDRTARLLGFSTSDYINRSYGYLYLAFCRERRIRPKDMLFRNRGRKKWIHEK
jgi:adenylate cyclase class 2